MDDEENPHDGPGLIKLDMMLDEKLMKDGSHIAIQVDH